jgi:hypothetical protein
MADVFGGKPFGMREIKVKVGSAASIALPAAMTLTFKERVKHGEMPGDDTIQSLVSLVEAAEFDVEAGGIDLAAYAAMSGRTSNASSTTPNRTNELTGKGGDVFPYFALFGRSVAEGLDDLHVVLWKCKLSEGIGGSLKNGEFFTTGIKGLAIPRAGDLAIWQFVENETAVAIT